MKYDFLSKTECQLLIESVDDIERDVLSRQINIDQLLVGDLGMFAKYEGSIKLLTMHRAKGREFDAVAIIDLHEGKVPHFTARTPEEIDEAKRLLYVAITRARRTVMYIVISVWACSDFNFAIDKTSGSPSRPVTCAPGTACLSIIVNVPVPQPKSST